MVKVKYLPEPGTPDDTETLNHKFSARRAADVTDEAVLAVLRGNPFFQVLDDEKGSRTPTPAPKTAEVVLTALEQVDGTFAIMSGPDLIKEGLTKEDADAFNALSDEDKAEYVAA
ncbi:hypothetical protein C7U61_14620 [Rhizobium sp. JAB6]|uniref:hypothetical protein n=1 Tax=Rhizobium sp. JAB6 TaxID=2127050 RepID=UPI000D131EFA|nr:hypothetical protein [Rhizobium sp. JAB6]PST19723.1 hypothetical protein C7U61_14620 [Rhizobium sp. JAB6]